MDFEINDNNDCQNMPFSIKRITEVLPEIPNIKLK
jgi:hypothetical protein